VQGQYIEPEPSPGPQNGGLPGYVTAPGRHRGDESDNDGYLYAMVKADHWINKSSNKKFSKKRTMKRRR
jgi:hypothetical protein